MRRPQRPRILIEPPSQLTTQLQCPDRRERAAPQRHAGNADDLRRLVETDRADLRRDLDSALAGDAGR